LGKRHTLAGSRSDDVADAVAEADTEEPNPIVVTGAADVDADVDANDVDPLKAVEETGGNANEDDEEDKNAPRNKFLCWDSSKVISEDKQSTVSVERWEEYKTGERDKGKYRQTVNGLCRAMGRI